MISQDLVESHKVLSYGMRRLFEGGYYFALLFVKCGVNSRTATKRRTASIQANRVY